MWSDAHGGGGNNTELQPNFPYKIILTWKKLLSGRKHNFMEASIQFTKGSLKKEANVTNY